MAVSRLDARANQRHPTGDTDMGMNKLKHLDFSRMKGKDALEIADAVSSTTRMKLVNAAGIILPTKSHTQAQPSLMGLVVILATLAFLDANTEEETDGKL